MTTADEIEAAVAKRRPEELARFRAWFETFDATIFDEKIARDAKSAKLDRFAEAARQEFRKGRFREL